MAINVCSKLKFKCFYGHRWSRGRCSCKGGAGYLNRLESLALQFLCDFSLPHYRCVCNRWSFCSFTEPERYLRVDTPRFFLKICDWSTTYWLIFVVHCRCSDSSLVQNQADAEIAFKKEISLCFSSTSVQLGHNTCRKFEFSRNRVYNTVGWYINIVSIKSVAENKCNIFYCTEN